MLAPKRTKHRKSFRGRMKGISTRGTNLEFGQYGLKSQGRAWLSSAQIEAGRRAVTNSLKRKGRVWIRVFPAKPVTARPSGVRMGSGKGDIDRYVMTVTPGRIIYEVAGVEYGVAKEALSRAADKMPFKTKIIRRD